MNFFRILLPLILASRLLAQEFAPNWAWTGAVTDTSAVIVAGVGPNTSAQVHVRAENIRKDILTFTAQADALGVARFELSRLLPNTSYAYRVVYQATQSAFGRFKTFPVAGEPASFRVALGSCNSNPTSVVFRAISHQQPLFFLHTGDLHYSDIASNRPADFRRAILQNVTAPSQGDLYRAMGIAYVWDDHDYGPNNSRWDNPSRVAAHQVYRELVPHYPLALSDESPDRAAPIAQAFTIGRVRFVLTDLRSEHSREKGSLMGTRQREWFLAELQDAAKTHALIVWVSSVPWVSSTSSDNWAGGREERKTIANFVKAHGIPLCIVAGDAHMLAIDDGTNADYAEGGGAPIPVFQAAALERGGSYKGGPYSHGANPGPLQFGLLDIADDGTTLRVTFSGRSGADGLGDSIVSATQDGDQPLEYSFTFPR